ncbi:MAG TPA: molybdopterin cofactor-binding domain-containing protein [Saprospiraceae bacterium]|nr:molybdopterin cofactor-binding domain-containing protein [Saprospiraceae bacterium]
MKTKINRRKFVQLSAASSLFLAVGCVPKGDQEGEVVNVSSLPSTELNQFIKIDREGKVTLMNHRPEMGQGTYQAIPMILAEELEVDINRITIEQSPANSERYGRQMVVGSHSIQNEYDKLRKMGAAAKAMLLSAAADRWQMDPADCTARNGQVTNTQNKETLHYGELVEAAAQMDAPADPKLKDPKDFKIIGQPIPRADIPLKTNGQAEFGIDKSVPGMLYASIERSPVFLGKVAEIDDSEALKVPGVKQVLKTSREVFGRTRQGVAVLADTYWAAYKGRQALKVTWDQQGLEANTSASIMEDYRKASAKNDDVQFEKGNADRAFSSSELLTATYEMPYQAHVPMEPMNAIVHVEKDKAAFWGSTQNPNGIRSFLAEKLNMSPENVAINYTFMGGGFGRRSLTDIAEEAADLSQQSGVPVKVIWTREDDQTQGPFRACSLNILKGALDEEGQLKALEHKVVCQEIRNQTGNNNTSIGQMTGGINTEYGVPNMAVKAVVQKHYVPISYWRAVYHSTNPFAHESFIDEMATKAGKDPLAFRLAMMQDHPRFRRVLEEARKIANWDASRSLDQGRGIAIAERSGAHFAMVVDVSRDNQKIKIDKITTILDLGTCVNPDTVKAQTEGSIVMGLSATLAGLTIENGAVVEQNFDSYPLLKISQCPEIETHILPSDAKPDGAGESGLPTVAPALANAIYDLTGQRIRKLPLSLELGKTDIG